MGTTPYVRACEESLGLLRPISPTSLTDAHICAEWRRQPRRPHRGKACGPRFVDGGKRCGDAYLMIASTAPPS